MRFPRKAELKVRATLDVTPMINVMFLLIIFFMLTSPFVVQTSIPIELAQSEGAAQVENRELTITLAVGEGGPENGGGVYLDDKPVDEWSALRSALVDLKSRRPEALVMVRPDRRVPTERLMKVLGIANGVGITHCGIAAQQPAARGE